MNKSILYPVTAGKDMYWNFKVQILALYNDVEKKFHGTWQ
jgi:hypothetical protein